MTGRRRQPMRSECRAVARLLDAYLDGELGPSAMRSVRAHVRACPECRQLVHVAERARQTVRALPRVPVRPELTSRILRAVAADGRGALAGEREALARLHALPRIEPTDELHARILAAVAPEAERRQARLCATFADRVEALLDGDLAEGLSRSLHSHAEHCPACAGVLREARAGRAALSGVRRLAPSSEQRARVVAALNEERARRQPVWRSTPALAMVAACALFAVAVLALPMFRTPVTGPASGGPSVASAVHPQETSGPRVATTVAQAAAEAGLEAVSVPTLQSAPEVRVVSAPAPRRYRATTPGTRHVSHGPSGTSEPDGGPKNGSTVSHGAGGTAVAANQSSPGERVIATTMPDLATDQTGIGRVENMTLTL